MMVQRSRGEGRGMFRVLAGWAVCAGLALMLGTGLGLGGCSGPPQSSDREGAVPPPPAPGPALDPLATVAAIDDSGTVNPGTVELSKSQGSRVQWKNESNDTMMIILRGSHVAELVPPDQYSTSNRVCIDCENGFYPYVIKRMVAGKPMNPKKGPPGEPQVGVGD